MASKILAGRLLRYGHAIASSRALEKFVELALRGLDPEVWRTAEIEAFARLTAQLLTAHENGDVRAPDALVIGYAQLAFEERAAFALTALEHFTRAEIAHILGVDDAAVAVALASARQKLAGISSN